MTVSSLTFSLEEFAGRIARLRNRLRTSNVDIALFDEIEAMTWLSGYGTRKTAGAALASQLRAHPFLIRALDTGPLPPANVDRQHTDLP
jgi:hypothetical protein